MCIRDREDDDIHMANANSGGHINFHTHNGTAVGERLRIDSSGKIGINYAATPPHEDLMVRGIGSKGGITVQHLSSGNSYGTRFETRGSTNTGFKIATQFNSTYNNKIEMNGNGQVTIATDGQTTAGHSAMLLSLVCAGNHGSTGMYPGIFIRSTYAGATSGSYIWTTDDNWGLKTDAGIAGLAIAPDGNSASSGHAKMYIGSDGVTTLGPDTFSKIGTSRSCNAALSIAGGSVSIGPEGNATACKEPGRYVLGWYMCTSASSGYWHLKTDMWAGGSPHGNNEWIMGGFHIHGYRYSSSGVSEEIIYFHNWGGGYANLDIENWGSWNAGSTVYTSSDGYVTLKLPTSTYVGYVVDYIQYPWYSLRNTKVTSATNSSSNI